MKKISIAYILFIVAVFTLSLTACGDKSNNAEMFNSEIVKNNLELNGYTVSITLDLDDKNGTHLSATKNEEYIEIYWLENLTDGDYFYNKLKINYPNYTALAQIIDDSTKNILVYCGTVSAVDDAGIKTIVTKIDSVT